MSGSRWSALLVVVALAAVGLAIRPCGGAGQVARRGPALDNPTTSVAPSPSSEATPSARRRGALEDEATKSTAPPAAPAKTTIVVRVVAKEDGKPVAGANVLLDEETDGKDDVEHRAKTDAAGIARFVDLPPCTAMVRAWADDFVRSDFTGDVAKPGEELTLDVVLDRGVALEGVVRDSRSGRPIAGATVDVELGGAIDGIGSSGTSAPHLGLLTTGEDGRFRLRVPPDEMVTPTASARGYVPTGHTVIVPTGETSRPPLVLRLDASGLLRGTVRGPNGEAVAKAAVCAVPADSLLRYDGNVVASGRRWATLAATTDAAGRYELDGLALGGVYVAFATADGFARSASIERVLVTNEAPAADVDFIVRSFGELRVRVVDADGSPCAANVRITSNDDDDSPEPQETDARGAATFSKIAPGPWRAGVFGRGVPYAQASFDVGAEGTTEVTVKMERGQSIAGVVVDDLGAPVPDARVDAERTATDDGPKPPSSGGTTTDKAGRFEIVGLRRVNHAVTVRAEGHDRIEYVCIDAPAVDVRLVLRRLATAKLHVVVPKGAAPPELIVIRIEVPTRSIDGGAEAWSGGGGDARPFESFTLGVVPIENIPPGRCRIRVMTKEFAPIVRECDAKPGETVDLGDATLDRGVDVAGRVEDAAGTPIVGARVTTGGAYAGDTVSPDVR
jgi:protocatechuate 3,4-dioxygenase beta subunit